MKLNFFILGCVIIWLLHQGLNSSIFHGNFATIVTKYCMVKFMFVLHSLDEVPASSSGPQRFQAIGIMQSIPNTSPLERTG